MDYKPRRAQPSQAFTWHDGAGERHDLKADEDGVLRPTNDAEQALADAYSLPVARKTTEANADQPDAPAEEV